MPSRISVNGTELEYQLRGTAAGEPVVLIHWGVAATWAEPLLDQPALASRYQLLSYHRAGFAGSGPLQGPPAMAAHAAHCHQLMRQLGIARDHIVGHSSSVLVALQLALDAPDAVHTLSLMEAARPAAPTDAERQFKVRARTTGCHTDRSVFAEAQLESSPCLEMPTRSALAGRPPAQWGSSPIASTAVTRSYSDPDKSCSGDQDNLWSSTRRW